MQIGHRSNEADRISKLTKTVGGSHFFQKNSKARIQEGTHHGANNQCFLTLFYIFFKKHHEKGSFFPTLVK